MYNELRLIFNEPKEIIRLGDIVNKDCKLCNRCKSRKHIIMGVGNYTPDAMMIGDWPDMDDDSFGGVYSGKMDTILNRILSRINIRRNDMYITYLVKCYAKKDPKVVDIKQCSRHVDKEIRSVNPKIVFLAGKHVLKRFMVSRKANIVKMHGSIFSLDNVPGKVFMPITDLKSVLVNSNFEMQIAKDIQRGINYVKDGAGDKIPT